MSLIQKNFKWLCLVIIIVLGLVGGIVFLLNRASQNNFHLPPSSQNNFHLPLFPPCEAMRPYIEYHGTMYFAVLDGKLLSPSDLGPVITTIGDSSNQAKSCMPSGITVYSVKGYTPASGLAADFEGLMLFEPASPTPTPSASPTTHQATLIRNPF